MTKEEALEILDWIPTKGEEVDALEMAIEALKERKTGKWILTTRAGILCGVCHSGFRRMPTLEGKPMFIYCPLCGAKMEGVEYAKD